MSLPRPNSLQKRRTRGFALLITITLVAFLVLILVSLATLTRVETQVATNSQHQAQARQNALLALNIAIGQLQKHTGPDQRITATADLRPLPPGTTNDPASGQSLNTGTTEAILDAIDDHWRASRNRRWVGVWRDPDPTRSALDPNTPSAAVPVPQFESWLVSGNESVGNAHLPDTQVANFTLAGVTSHAAPTAVFGTTTDPYRLLVGRGTARILADEDLHHAVVAPEIAITSSSVPGLPGPQTIGHYAWWIGDEGVKARANQIDPFAGSGDPLENRLRLQTAHRPAIESMTGMAGLYPTDDDDLTKVISANQLSQTDPDPEFRSEIETHYHDLTIHSRGVLADVRHGGLKSDLSWMLGQTSATGFQNELRELYADTTVTTDDPVLGPAFTPYVVAPGSGVFVGNFQLGLSRTATWSQLRSYFNFGNSPTAAVPGVIDANKAHSRIQRTDTQGLGPLLVQAKAFVGLEVTGSGEIHVQIHPLVVLANPYNVPLTGTYWVRFNRPALSLRTGPFDSTNPPPVAPTESDLGLFPTAHSVSYNVRMNLTLENIEIPPGEARVYCLDGDYDDTGSGAVQEVKMIEGYDDAPVFTLNTGRSLGADTHAALYVGSAIAEARLYGADPATNTGADDNLIQYVYGRPLNQAGVGSNIFIVYPTAAGETTSGGGCWYLIYDALTTSPSTSQQANFLQFNPRTLAMFYTAHAGKTHPIENTQSYQRNGSPGNDAWFTADLLFDTTGDRVRWGPVTKADASNPLAGSPPPGVADPTGFVNVLYDLPRPDHPVASIAQLQHFSPSGFIFNGRFGNTSAEQFATQANTFQVNYPTGNSYPNPRVPRERAFYANTSSANTSTVGTVNMGTAYDGSWLYNEVLADRFHFSTYPANDPFDFATDTLVNSRLRPFRPAAQIALDNPAGFRGAPRTAATNLLVEGAFNINSTSREAWKAILSSLRNVPVAGDTTVQVPFSRTLFPAAGHAAARTANSAAAWAGFHNLSDAEIADLADELVLQIRRRGPFLSMADFINRRLVTAANDPLDLGLSGALQAAIDAVLNDTNDVDPAFRGQSLSHNFADPEYLARTLTSGAPGYLMQADVLSPLGPGLAARSDTFTIRTYGDVSNPVTGDITARAWCEAVVQRTPDYVDPVANAPHEIPVAGSDNARFGRRYEVISFRWLSPEDI